MLHFGSSAVTAETMKTIRISALTRSAISRLYVEPVANQPDVFDVFFLNLYLPRLQPAGGYCFWAREMWVCPSMGPSARRVRLRPNCFLTFPLSPAACRRLKVQGGGVKDAKMPKSFFGFISVARDPICRQTTLFQFFYEPLSPWHVIQFMDHNLPVPGMLLCLPLQIFLFGLK